MSGSLTERLQKCDIVTTISGQIRALMLFFSEVVYFNHPTRAILFGVRTVLQTHAHAKLRKCLWEQY